MRAACSAGHYRMGQRGPTPTSTKGAASRCAGARSRAPELNAAAQRRVLLPPSATRRVTQLVTYGEPHLRTRSLTCATVSVPKISSEPAPCAPASNAANRQIDSTRSPSKTRIKLHHLELTCNVRSQLICDIRGSSKRKLEPNRASWRGHALAGTSGPDVSSHACTRIGSFTDGWGAPSQRPRHVWVRGARAVHVVVPNYHWPAPAGPTTSEVLLLAARLRPSQQPRGEGHTHTRALHALSGDPLETCTGATRKRRRAGCRAPAGLVGSALDSLRSSWHIPRSSLQYCISWSGAGLTQTLAARRADAAAARGARRRARARRDGGGGRVPHRAPAAPRLPSPCNVRRARAASLEPSIEPPGQRSRRCWRRARAACLR